MTLPLLTTMILTPLAGAVVQSMTPRQPLSRLLALSSSLISAIIGFVVLAGAFATHDPESLRERFAWVGSYAISYDLSVDGMARIAVLIVSVLFPVLIAAEWRRSSGFRGFYALLLVLQGALLGAVCAQDLFLLFFFWGLSSVPVFFLVGVWGSDGREAAAFRALVTSAAGNALFFGALMLVYHARDPHTFSIADATGGMLPARSISVAGVSLSLANVAFLFVCLGVALRIPVWPFHGWFSRLADAAPPAAAVAVAAAIVPCGVQILARLGLQLFPESFSKFSDAIVLVGLVNLMIGAVAAFGQRKPTSLFASLVLAEVGICLVGLGSGQPSALLGTVYHQLCSALALAVLGLLFGSIHQKSPQFDLLSQRSGSGALMIDAPVAGVVMALSLATLAAVPGLGGFVGQSLVLMGGFVRSPMILVLVGLSVLLIGVCLFGTYRVLFLGGGTHERSGESHELSFREKIYLIPLVVLMVALGVYPKPLLDVIRPATDRLVIARVEAPAGVVGTSDTGTSPDGAPPPVEESSPDGRQSSIVESSEPQE